MSASSDNGEANPTWIACQIGAREHYAIPRALAARGRLAAFATDVWTPPGTLLARGGRYHPALAEAPCRIDFSRTALWRVLRQGKLSAFAGSRSRMFVSDGRWFARRLVKALADRFPSAFPELFFGYDTAFFEAGRWAKERGARCLVGQVDPAAVEWEIIREERARWPGWEVDDPDPAGVREHQARRETEWDLADRILVNSEWSRDALVRQGVSEDKLRVVPLVYQGGAAEVRDKRPGAVATSGLAHRDSTDARARERPFTVLWLGQVSLRKGIAYFFEAARKLRHLPIEFVVAGPVRISREGLATAPESVRFLGPVPRSEVSRLYLDADAFAFPTLSDGFGLTQLEALAHGLPLVVTPCCARVIEDGKEGFVVAPRDADALAERFQQLFEEPDRRERQSQAALETAGRYWLSRLEEDLERIGGELVRA